MAETGSDSHKAMVKQLIFSVLLNALLDEAEMASPEFYLLDLKSQQELLLSLSEKYSSAIPKPLALPVLFPSPKPDPIEEDGAD